MWLLAIDTRSIPAQSNSWTIEVGPRVNAARPGAGIPRSTRGSSRLRNATSADRETSATAWLARSPEAEMTRVQIASPTAVRTSSSGPGPRRATKRSSQDCPSALEAIEELARMAHQSIRKGCLQGRIPSPSALTNDSEFYCRPRFVTSPNSYQTTPRSLPGL